MDVHDPFHPTKIASIAFTGTEYTERLFLLGSTLYAGRQKGSGSGHHPELVALDVHNPYTPIITASSSLAATVYSIRALAHHLLIATNAGIFSLHAIAATSSKKFIEQPSLISTTSSVGLDYENNTIYSPVYAADQAPTILALKHYEYAP